MSNFLKYKYLVGLFFLSILFIECSKPDGPSDPVKPSDLSMVITKQGESVSFPYGDGSGIVNIKVTAKNADLYKITVDNETFESSSGNFTYTFLAEGTNSYTIYVSAYKGTQFISKSESVTIFVSSNLVWYDEFNTNGPPDNSKWGYDIGTGSNGWGNNELQYYTNRPENVVVEGGYLKIKSIKENYSGSTYTSARILTKGKFSFKYGKIEFRAKLPVGGGTWPALWMLGSNFTTVGWPVCGEIDVMEHVYNQLNVIHGALHHPGHSGSNPDKGTVTISNATSEFHLYSMEWRSSFIKFYVDNNLFYTFNNSSSVPFNHDFFIIMNCAMGGNFGGAVDPNFTNSTFEIDYVRVYK